MVIISLIILLLTLVVAIVTFHTATVLKKEIVEWHEKSAALYKRDLEYSLAFHRDIVQIADTLLRVNAATHE